MAVQEKFDLVIRAQDEATATLRTVNREVDKLGGAGVPRLTSSMSSYTREAIKADLKSAALGSRLAGLSPAVGQLSQAFLIGNPIIAAASFAVGVLTTEVIESIGAQDKYIESIKRSRSELTLLASATDSYGLAARNLLAEVDDLNVKERSRVAVQLSMAKHGLREATAMEMLGGSLKYVKMESDEQKEAVAELTIQMAKLNKEMAPTASENLRKAFEATIGPMTSVGEIEERLRLDIEATNQALRQRIALMNGNAFGPLADTSGAGLGMESEQARLEKERLREAFAATGEGPMSWLQDYDESVGKATEKWQEFSSVVMSSTDQLAGGITDMFFGLQTSLSDIFKGMAANWIKYFINEVIKQTALKLGFSLFSAIFPGSGTLVGSAAGVGDVGISGILGKSGMGTGVDLAAAGAKRFAGRGAGPASVSITIAGDVIGDQEYVNRKIIPAIEQAVAYGQSKIQVR